MTRDLCGVFLELKAKKTTGLAIGEGRDWEKEWKQERKRERR